MAAKRGVKSQFSRADIDRISRLRAENWSDERIGQLFGVHRTTISRLRHAIEGGNPPDEELSPLAQMIAENNERLSLFYGRRAD